MQKNKKLKQPSKPPVRQKLKLSDLEMKSAKDIDSMFGVWNEADHCD